MDVEGKAITTTVYVFFFCAFTSLDSATLFPSPSPAPVTEDPSVVTMSIEVQLKWVIIFFKIKYSVKKQVFKYLIT